MPKPEELEGWWAKVVRWKWRAVLVLALPAFLLGFIGQREYDCKIQDKVNWWPPSLWSGTGQMLKECGKEPKECGKEPKDDLSSAAYHTLQLFILHAPHLEGKVPPPLHWGRWLAAVAGFSATIIMLMRVFRSEWQLFLASYGWDGHVVICGLGRLGRQLAEEYRRNGKRIVAITRGSAEHIELARDHGIGVLTGDACNLQDLKRAGALKASQVIAACGDDQTNVAVAAAVRQLLVDEKARNGARCQHDLESYILIADPQLRQTLRQDNPTLFPDGRKLGYSVKVRGLDLFELAARQALNERPLDFTGIREDEEKEDQRVVHLVIVGFGPMGQQLALQAAKIGHFANFKKLKVTVFEREGSSRPENFHTRYPMLSKKICDFTSEPVSIDAADSVKKVACSARPQEEQEELVTFAICWDSGSETASAESNKMFEKLERDDPINLRFALDLTKEIKEIKKTSRRVLVFQTRKSGLGALVPWEGTGLQVRAFGMWEEAYTLDTLLHERQDAIAKALHRAYLKKMGNKEGPACYEWDGDSPPLKDCFKDSNRQAADHIPVKLRAIGIGYDTPGPKKDSRRGGQDRRDNISLNLLKQLLDENVELLAKMEHKRWCAEKWLQGYQYGTVREDEGSQKTHPLLQGWDDLTLPKEERLTEGEKELDREQVRAIPDALKEADRIYRIDPQESNPDSRGHRPSS